MKASNIILISIFASATILITVGAMQLRFGDHTEFPETAFRTEKYNLPDFKFLKIHDISRHIDVEASDEQRLEIVIEKESELPKMSYSQNGDTLIIDKLAWDKMAPLSRLTIYIPADLEIIEAKNAKIYLRSFDNETLDLRVDRVDMSIDKNVKLEKLMISNATGSNISVFSRELDTLTVNLNESHLTAQGTIGKLSGSVENNSVLSIKEVQDFDFKKDNSSKLHHWN